MPWGTLGYGAGADSTVPEGSPFRPLYDDRIWFSFQPIALVVAEEPEVARFAASLVRVEYAEETHVTDIHRQRDRAATVEPGSSHSIKDTRYGPSAERRLEAREIRYEITGALQDQLRSFLQPYQNRSHYLHYPYPFRMRPSPLK